MRWRRLISRAATAGIGRLAAAWWLARRSSAWSTSSTISSVAAPTLARVFSTGATTGGGVAMVRPGRRWRVCSARRRRSSIHKDPASTGPPARPASSHGAASAPSAGAALVEGLSAAPSGGTVLGPCAAGVLAAGVFVAAVPVVGVVVAGPGSAGLVPVAAASGAVPPGAARSCGAAGAGAVLALCVLGAGDGQAPPGKDQVGVAQVPPVGLVGVAGGREDLGVAVGVPEAVFGDLAEGVPGPDGVAGTAPLGHASATVRGSCAGWEG